MKVSQKEAASMIDACFDADAVAFIYGSPGIGKSAIAHAVAAKRNLFVIDFRLPTADPCDLMGFPRIREDKAGYVPMETFPIRGDAIPEGYSGWLILYDELPSAPTATQTAAYKIILDRMVGVYHLHDKVFQMAAGNKVSDNSGVEEMNTALQSRLIHMELELNNEHWIQWALGAGINHYIIDYIRWKPSALYTFKPDHDDDTYACPRTWEFASNLIKRVKVTSPLALPLLSGTISGGVASEFLTFCEIYTQLPTIDKILQNPEGVEISNEPSVLFALSGTLSNHLTESTSTQLMKCISRMPKEFQVLTMRDVAKKDPLNLNIPAVSTWLLENKDQLFG